MSNLVVFGALLAFLVALFFPILYPYFKMKLILDFKSRDVMIGVLSARDNFDRRQIIRSTWLKAVKSNPSVDHRVGVRFIVGNAPCPYPPEDRMDEFSCDSWNVTMSSENSESFAFKLKLSTAREDSSMPQRIQTRVSIKVHHPIIMTKLGVLETLVDNVTNMSVQLIDTAGGVEVVSSNFLAGLGQGVLRDGYRYRPVEPYILPKVNACMPECLFIGD